jgi:hypothetical protein
MELADAIKCLMPLQVEIPYPKRPLQLQGVPAAEVFLVESVRGAAVVWLDLFWFASARGNRDGSRPLLASGEEHQRSKTPTLGKFHLIPRT